MQPKFLSACLAFFGTLASFTFTTTNAQAHATLVSANPAPDSEVTTPKIIELHFSEMFEPKFSRFRLTDIDGAEVEIEPIASKDMETLAGTPTTALEPGLYTVSWTTIGHDSHKRSGTFSFSVK